MNFRKSISLFLIFSFVLQVVVLPEGEVRARQKEQSVKEKKTKVRQEVPAYASLMREYEAVKTEEVGKVQPLRKTEAMKLRQQGKSTVKAKYKKSELAEMLGDFRKTEEEKLKQLGVEEKKRTQYLKRLEKQARNLTESGVLVSEFGKNVQDLKEVKIPKQPSEFKFQEGKIKVRAFRTKKEKSFLKKVLKKLSFWSAPEAKADYALEDLPELADLESDAGEIVLNSEIYALANELENNPVNIFNFVRNNIEYEPYYGAKKGALGCLEEGVCNDTDAASLTLALMRASGIPARYQKDLIYVPVAQLQALLGVEETKTVYAALDWNKVPVYVDAEGDLGVEEDFEIADFSGETHLILEWTYPEIFYEQDERGGNFANETVLTGSGVTTTDLRNELVAYPKKQWIEIDPMMKGYSNTHNEIVADTANFETYNFWKGFLQYQGDLAPIEKYASDLLTQTGKDIHETQYQSTKNLVVAEFEILPPALPYEVLNTEEYPTENWSVLPESQKHKVTISLLDESGATVLTHELNASEVNNTPIDLFYEGASETDQAIIESYGGIHAVPVELVAIKPYLNLNYANYTADSSVEIGDLLALQFEYSLNGEELETSGKYSIAGNAEGIYMTFSQIPENAFLDDATDEDRNSKILLEGNAEIARQYLLRIQKNGEVLEKALDLDYNLMFSRAVVTQNRVLTKVDGVPTTFDFKGLTIDAAAFIQDYSRIGNYANHRDDFHLLWGLQASYDEARIFEEIAGLEAIATVPGLQHAYANPSDYTIYEIDSTNAAVIDTLTNLSANTRANMHAAVQDGSTVITPDDLITSGAWYGLLYVVLRSDGTANYAIGEQVVGNGGWTQEEFENVVFEGESLPGDYLVAGFSNPLSNEYHFFHSDDATTKDINCRISVQKYVSILADSNYNFQLYGPPCLKGKPKVIGTVEHHYIVSTRGAKFYASDSSLGSNGYWETANQARAVLFTDGKNEDLDEIKVDQTFKFSPVARTFLYTGSYDDGELLTVYYEPTFDQRGKGWVVYGEFLEKLEGVHYAPQAYYCNLDNVDCGKNNWIVSYLGFPIMNRGNAADSMQGGEGEFQGFAGGRIYKETSWFDKLFYVPGKIAEHYIENASSGGRFGFPIEDPWYDYENEMLVQEFETGYVNLIDEVTEEGEFVQIIRSEFVEVNSEEYWEGFEDQLFEEGVYLAMGAITGAGMSKIVKTIVEKIASKKGGSVVLKKGAVKFIPYVGWGLTAVSAISTASQVSELHTACTTDNKKIDGKNPKYYCGKRDAIVVFGAIGFVSQSLWDKYKAESVLGVVSEEAVAGKNKLLNSGVSDEEFDLLVRNIRKNVKMKEKAFKNINLMSDENVATLMRDERKFTKFFENEKYSKFIANSRDIYRAEHVLEGTNGGGFHHYPSRGIDTDTIKGTLVEGNAGVYKAKVIVNGELKVANDGYSTFFPNHWDQDDVMEAVNQAYTIRQFRRGNTYFAEVELKSSKIEIEMYIDTDGKIISAFPSENNF